MFTLLIQNKDLPVRRVFYYVSSPYSTGSFPRPRRVLVTHHVSVYETQRLDQNIEARFVN